MTFASKRRVLSYLLSAVIAILFVCALISGVNLLTVGNKHFYVNSISTKALAAECDKQLSQKYKTLSAKSNLPLDIFESVKVKFDTRESLDQAAEFLFDENDETLKNGSRYDYFKATIDEYNDANSIKMSENSVKLVATEAQQIYSDTVGIHDLKFLQNDVQKQNTQAVRSLSISLIVMAFAAFLLAYVYDKKVKCALYVANGVMAGGIATALSALVLKLAHFGSKVSLSPSVWNDIFAGMTAKILILRAVSGIAALILGIVIFVLAQRRLNREQMRKDTRFSKIFSKL